MAKGIRQIGLNVREKRCDKIKVMSSIQVRSWTRDEYERMIEAGVFDPEERAELINGEILKMTPQGSAHAIAILLAQEKLRVAFGTGCHVRAQLPLASDPSSEPEPDIAVISGKPRDYRDCHPTSALLVVEISDATLEHDREIKGSLYARAGLSDYWILNLIDRHLEVYREAIPMPEAAFGYGFGRKSVYLPGDVVSPLAAPQARLKVADLLP